MKVELRYTELSKIESALLDKIDKVDGFIRECDDLDRAKELLEYSLDLHKLYDNITGYLLNYSIMN